MSTSQIIGLQRNCYLSLFDLCGIMTKNTMPPSQRLQSCMYEFVLCLSLCAVTAINLLVSNTTFWRLYVGCWAIIMPQTNMLDQWYEDNDLNFLNDWIHNGEWTGYNYGFMTHSTILCWKTCQSTSHTQQMILFSGNFSTTLQNLLPIVTEVTK